MTIRNGALLSLMALGLGLSLASPLYAENPPGKDGEHDPIDPSGTPKKTPNGGTVEKRSLADLTKFLNITAIGPAWWRAAVEVLEIHHKERVEKNENAADPLKFIEGLTFNDKKDAFRAAIDVFFLPQPELKALASNAADTSAKGVASRYVMEWRLGDPLVKLVAKYFSQRPETAIDSAMELSKLPELDDNQSAALANKMMSLINRKQRETLRDFLKKVDGEQNAAKLGYDPKVIRALHDTVEVTLNPGLKDTGNALQKAFAPLYVTTLANNALFHKMVDQARAGDTQALAFLRQNYKADDLLDFIGGQIKSGNDGVAVGLTRLLATPPPNEGQPVKADAALTLNLKLSNAGYGNNGENVSLYLGKNDEEIRAALQALHKTPPKSHEDASRVVYTPEIDDNGLQVFTLGGFTDTPSKRYYASKDSAGKLTKLEGKDAVPADKVGTQPVLVPLAPPPKLAEGAKPPAGGTPPTDTKPDATPALVITAAKVKDLIGNENKCQRCHAPTGKVGPALAVSGSNNVDLRINGKTFLETIQYIRDSAAMKNKPAALDGIGTEADPHELLKWAKAQQEALAAAPPR